MAERKDPLGSEDAGEFDDGFIPNPSDALNRRPASRSPKSGRKGGSMKLLAFLVLLSVGAGAAVWYFMGDQIQFGDGGQVPMVSADMGPVKVRPETPGGMDVPNRDKLVYDRMEGGDSRPQVERLLPPAETPIQPPESEPEPEDPPAEVLPAVPPAADVRAVKRPEPAPLVSRNNAPAPLHEAEEAKADDEAEEPELDEKAREARRAVAERHMEASKPTTPPLRQAPTPLADAPSGAEEVGETAETVKGYRIQLAAVRTPEQAREEWNRLRSKNPEVLGPLSLSVTKVDLGKGKGIFYRLRGGSLPDEKQARDVCAELAKRKVGCLVVRPDE